MLGPRGSRCSCVEPTQAGTSAYLIARLAKPRLIVETGIRSGLGSMLILRALQRNAAEGAPGELVSVDVAPNAGWLAQGSASGPWRRLTGPSDHFFREKPASGFYAGRESHARSCRAGPHKASGRLARTAARS